MDTTQLNVLVHSPDKLIWEGKAESVSSENSRGEFSVLPAHSNFVTMIESKPIHVKSGSAVQTFQYESAVLTVRDNTVTIYTGI